MKDNRIKRSLALILVIVMVVSMFPTSAFADQTTMDDSDNEVTSEEVILSDDSGETQETEEKAVTETDDQETDENSGTAAEKEEILPAVREEEENSEAVQTNNEDSVGEQDTEETAPTDEVPGETAEEVFQVRFGFEGDNCDLVHDEDYIAEIEVGTTVILKTKITNTTSEDQELRIPLNVTNAEAIDLDETVEAKRTADDSVLTFYFNKEEKTLTTMIPANSVFDAEIRIKVLSEVTLTVDMEHAASYADFYEEAVRCVRTAEPEPVYTSWNWEDDTAAITVETSEKAQIPEGAVLTVIPLMEGTEAYDAAVEAILTAQGLTKEDVVISAVLYDIYFTTVEGERYEPAAEENCIRMTIGFKEGAFSEKGEIEPVHILEDGQVELPQNEAEEENMIAFQSASFSVVGGVMLLADNAGDCYYAVLYDSGELVFQTDKVADPAKGTVVSTYEVPKTGYDLNGTEPAYRQAADSITKISFRDTISIQKCNGLFEYLTEVTAIDFTNWDTTAVTEAFSLFGSNESLGSIVLKNKEFTNLVKASYMFNSIGVDTIDISGCSFPSLQQGTYAMFGKAKNVNLSGVSMPKLTKVENWFTHGSKDESSLETVDMSNMNLSSVTSMSSMFRGCNKLESADLTNLVTETVTDLGSMFYECKSLKKLNLSGWNTSNVTNMQYVFYHCDVLESVDVGGWNTGKVTKMNDMFEYCQKLTGLDVSKWNTSNVTNMSNMFYNVSSLTSLDLSNWDVSKVTSMQYMFRYMVELQTLNVSGWDTSSLTKSLYMFANDYKLKDLDVSTFFDQNDTKAEKTINYMFMECTSLTELDVSKWDTSTVVQMADTFRGCKSLNTLDVSNWDTHNVTHMSDIFYECTALEKLDVSGWNTEKVTSMMEMFFKCSSLKVLDLSGFDMSSVNNVHEMMWKLDSLVMLKLGKNCELTKGATNAKLTGDWINITESASNYMKETTGTSLCQEYNGSTMAGTYVKPVKVTFQANGGSPNATKMCYYTVAIGELPEEPTRTGYDFQGWYTEKNGGDQISEDTPVVQDTYYAQWKPYTYTLTLKANGADHEDVSVTLNYEDIYALPSDWTMEGMELTEWNTRKDGSGDSFRPGEEILSLVTDDKGSINLYAQWREPGERVTVTFDAAGGKEVSSVTLNKDGSLKTIPETAKDDYTFRGWKDENGNKVTTSTVFHEDTVLTAQWQRNPIINFFDHCGYLGNYQRSVAVGTPIGSLPALPERGKNNMVCTGWYTQETGGTRISSSWIISDEVIAQYADDNGYIEVHAQWGHAPKFNTNGGTFTEYNDYPVNPESNPIYKFDTLPKVERDGYIFDGWYTSDGAKKIEEGDSLDLSKGFELVAKWKRADTVTLTFNGNGGSFAEKGNSGTLVKEKSIDVLAGEPILDVYIPTRTGYEFSGWKDAAGNEFGSNASFTKDTTLYAQWAAKNCTVTFDSGVGTMYSSDKIVKVPADSTLNSIPGAILEVKMDDANNKAGYAVGNYILEGWYTGENGTGTKLTKDTVITEDCTYYAKYVPEMKSSSTTDIKYSYGAAWTNANNINADDDGVTLELHPTTNTEQTATLHLRFNIDTAIKDDVAIPAGNIRITLPSSIWEDWNGNVTGTSNVSKSLPEYPATSGRMVFSYIDNKDGTYTLVNNQPMYGGTGADMTISYTVIPWNVRGGATDSNGNYVDGVDYFSNTFDVTFQVDADNDGTWETDEKVTLKNEMHTKVEAYASKKYESISYSWNSAWGEAPADASDYFYVTWLLTENINNKTTQPYTFSWSEETVHDGDAILYRHNRIPSGSFSVDSYDWVDHSPVYTANKGGNGSVETYVVTKLPMSLLADIPAEGLDIYNEAVVTEYWKSGYTTSSRVYDITTLNDDEYPTGEWDKHRYPRNGEMTINGGQETICDDKNKIELKWEIVYEGPSVNNAKDDIWNEETKSYSVKERTIIFEDGARGGKGSVTDANGSTGDLMYSSGSANAKYVWEPNTGNIILSDDDYALTWITFNVTEYDAICTNGRWSDPIEHTDRNDIQSIKVYLRYYGSDEFVYYTTVSMIKDGTKITLPENARGFRLEYPTAFFSTKFSVQFATDLLPTQKVQTLTQADIDKNATTIIKNVGRCQIYRTANGPDHAYIDVTNNTEGANDAQKQLYELNISKTHQKTRKWASNEGNVIWDSEEGTQDNPVVIAGWNYNNSGRRKTMTSGVFYDLLPAGTTVDSSTVFLIPFTTNTSTMGDNSNSYKYYKGQTSQQLDRGLYNISYVEDWESSGRTMMIIRFSMPEEMKANGVRAFYLLHNTYENVKTNGNTVLNSVAFVNTSEKRVTPSSLDYEQSKISEGAWFNSLQKTNEGFISYADASTHYIPVDAYSWAFNKTVATTGNAASKADTVYPGGSYTYYLSYGQSEIAKTPKLVFYDVLEAGSSSKGDDGTVQALESEWHGILQEVSTDIWIDKDDSSQKKCTPIIYYSTKDRASFTGTDYDIGNTATWSTVRPADSSAITAIAVDCSYDANGDPFVLTGIARVMVAITMQAPSDEGLDMKVAYNRGVVQHTTNDKKSEETSDSEEKIEKEDVTPKKTSDPTTGTKEEPKRVFEDDVLTYTLSLTNNGTMTVNDMVMEDEIPSGLLLQTTDITVRVGSGTELKIANSPRASVVREGQKLTFTIHSLLPGETIYFKIPTTVNIKLGTLVNEAKVIKVNGRDTEIKTEKTYHEVSKLGAYANKTDISGKGLPGAVLQILDSNGEVLETWTSDGELHGFAVPEAGTYYLHEKTPPAGYLTAEDIEFTISKTGIVKINGKTVTDIVMKDEQCAVLKVSKTVEGTTDSKTAFSFQLKLGETPVSGAAYTIGKTSYTTSSEGIFKLKAGETAEFQVEEGTYTVTEVNIPAQYQPEENNISKTVKTGEEVQFDFVNELATKTVSVEKIWDDDNNRNEKRPGSVQVQLMSGSAMVTSDIFGNSITNPVTLNAANGWKYSWNDLPTTKTDGTEISYSVVERKADGSGIVANGEKPDANYTAVYSVNSTGTNTVTNTYAPTGAVLSVWKTVNGVSELKAGAFTFTNRQCKSPAWRGRVQVQQQWFGRQSL